MRRNRLLRLAALTIFLGLASACSQTPERLERWANTPGSEEMYSEALLAEKSSHEVRVKSLELLMRQWEYSSSFLRNGGTISDLADTAERDRVMIDALAALAPFYEDESERNNLRAAVFHVGQAASSDEAKGAYADFLNAWLQEEWSPCVSSGALMLRDVLEVVGAERAMPRLASVITTGSYEDLLCMADQISGTSWLAQSEPIAQAYITRWTEGELPESEQQRFSLIEKGMQYAAKNDTMRAWLFAEMMNPQTPAPFRNAYADIIQRNRDADDIPRYTGLLSSEDNRRWMAAEAIVALDPEDGLTTVLEGLPADGEYGYARGEVRADGFATMADIFCRVRVVNELGEAARPAFEAGLGSDNVHARALSARCLGYYGTTASLAAIQAAASVGPEVVLPAWGGATWSQVLAETTSQIQAR